jgi:excinuclease ABC subunit A
MITWRFSAEGALRNPFRRHPETAGTDIVDKPVIRVWGARQNNLKDLDLEIPLYQLTVVTGISGSGKSSLAFDTLYAEGQRRYVESFSAYARQFLERLDRPQIERVEGIPPAIAIRQVNPIKTARSTVATLTELAEYVKLLFAKVATLHCGECGRVVRQDSPQQIGEELVRGHSGSRVMITFPLSHDGSLPAGEVENGLRRSGYYRLYHGGRSQEVSESLLRELLPGSLDLVADRLVLEKQHLRRIVDSLEAAFRMGKGRLAVILEPGTPEEERHPYSAEVHCPWCDISHRDPTPNLFSFNTPLGACDVCHGFGRTIGVDMDLVIPDKRLSLRQGAVKPWNTDAYREAYHDALGFCSREGIPVEVPFEDLKPAQRRKIIEGCPGFYGIRGFFEWLETRTYKMHIRVLLSRYRSYETCKACGGRRFRQEVLQYRIADRDIAGIYALSIREASAFFEKLSLSRFQQEVAEPLLREIRSRLSCLDKIGLGYLTLDRQSRTLSGGEVERAHLTTALGSSLVNTLYILDEPSIGLHARDSRRLVEILREIRDRENTVLVVEHDPEIILAADHLLDMGPSAGEQGGHRVYQGTPAKIAGCGESLTAASLFHTKSSGRESLTRSSNPTAEAIVVRGAAENNLRGVSVEIPLQRLVCISGVSGSGKSTLIREILYKGLCKALGKGTERPGRYKAIEGYEAVDDVIMVDPSPLGNTPRANPVTYVKAFDGIRALFAQTPLARLRQYSPGTFSFNSGKGRCESCQGEGFEKVEMQFLADVFVVCPDCGGARYRKEILEVTYNGKTIQQVLEMTVEEGRRFFEKVSSVGGPLRVLSDIGLGYLRLGQPLNTLSGGEAQRLKLSAHIIRSRKPHTLLLFDEPTTGLHLYDIQFLLKTFEKLLQRGHSIVVVEHNLEILKNADHIVDLGPEGGDAGGKLVAAGPPEEIIKKKRSHTGKALKHYLSTSANAMIKEIGQWGGKPTRKTVAADWKGGHISIERAREHNLKEIFLSIPRDRIVVVTGPSGSGKSTLAFDILFAEGQRRFLESLSAYARQYIQPMAKPDVDRIQGVPPTVAVEQKLSRGGRRSTVATLTEIYHYLRLLFAKVGVPHCTRCGQKLAYQTAEGIQRDIGASFRKKAIRMLAPILHGKKGHHRDLLRRLGQMGYTSVRLDGEMVAIKNIFAVDRYKEHDIDVVVAEIDLRHVSDRYLEQKIEEALRVGKGELCVLPHKGGQERYYSRRLFCGDCGIGFPEPDPRFFSFNSRYGACSECDGLGVIPAHGGPGHGNGNGGNGAEGPDWEACPECGGTRLRKRALSVKIDGKNIAECVALSPGKLKRFLRGLGLREREQRITQPIFKELEERLDLMEKIGLGYLGLGRAADTLSQGESRRVRLVAQLTAHMRGLCYILDEPTIGLHPRDNERLLGILQMLRDRGNSIVIVEHDEETIRGADFVVDLGPGAGNEGGEVVAAGPLASMLSSERSLTAQYLRRGRAHQGLEPRRPLNGARYGRLSGAGENNLKNVDVRVPLGRLTVVTGVSGSGKSTLVRQVLYKALRRKIQRARCRPGKYRQLAGWKSIRRVLEVDSSPIGKTPRSVPSTYVGIFDEIRKLFAMLPEARARGYSPGRFSFNLKGGRCDRCEGQGQIRMEMSFLPDVFVRCEQCNGLRYNDETLAVAYRGKNIADVLSMTVAEAHVFFAEHPRLVRSLKIMRDIGLGYLTLGQPTNTLSGGETQRLKLAEELCRGSNHETLYILDEPTTGLHLSDIQALMGVIHDLVDHGNTVIIIEHNPEMIFQADYIIDLGPEGGDKGGRVMAMGAPVELIRDRSVKSHTISYLRRYLEGQVFAPPPGRGKVLGKPRQAGKRAKA